MVEKVHKSDEEWKHQLTPEQFYVTRQAGTEPAFSGPYYKHKAEGTYHCICCENPCSGRTTSLNPERDGRVLRNPRTKLPWRPKPTTATA